MAMDIRIGEYLLAEEVEVEAAAAEVEDGEG